MVKRIVAKTKYDCTHLLGAYLDESHYDILVEEDVDCYQPPVCDLTQKSNCSISCETCEKGNDERRVAFKFRKNFFTQEEQMRAYEGLKLAAIQSQNRGLAAGPRGDVLTVSGKKGRDWVSSYQSEILDFLTNTGNKIVNDDSIESIRLKYKLNPNIDSSETRGYVWLTSEVRKVYPEYHGWFDKWVDGLSNKPPEMVREEANNVIHNWMSSTNYAKTVFSGVAGWYDRYPRIPFGRATAYTENHYDLFKQSFPFLKSLNRGFKELMPWRWANQKAAADKLDSRFLVEDTVFTTITVNRSFRTAAHYDAGDLDTGLSNLLVLGDGIFTGGYLVFPEYRIAVNVRPGDLLLVNNHEVMHGNTPIVLDDDEADRISIVCYFREKMLELKSYDYELHRKKFIESRKNNPNHPLQHKLWNGVSPGVFLGQEWIDYLKAHNIRDEDGLVDSLNEKSTLENFFGE